MKSHVHKRCELPESGLDDLRSPTENEHQDAPLAGYGLWQQPVYVNIGQEVHPYKDTEHFRSRTTGFTGDLRFWKTPSPEPNLNRSTQAAILQSIQVQRDALTSAAKQLSLRIARDYSPEKLLLVSILRAGVPIADWLSRLLPGAAVATTSLFVGVGIDRVSLSAIRKNHPDRQVVFVDGWTGKGGVAGEIKQLDYGPLAVLIDPWRLADYSGATDDILCPSALFTGPTTLGFSRSSIGQPDEPFWAYRFPKDCLAPELVRSWQDCIGGPLSDTDALASTEHHKPFHADTPLRLHSNEVCRALINSNPGELRFRTSIAEARRRYELLLVLADQQQVPCVFDDHRLKSLQTNVACTLQLKSNT